MKLQFSIEKIKARLEENKEKQSLIKNKGPKEKDIAADVLAKVNCEGDHLFRAVPYVHNADPVSDPFPERFYHFGIPGTRILYCPQKNENKPCHVCDFVWQMMKDNKGTEAAKQWKNFLPKKRLFIPGIFRGREAEGLKFFILSTFEEKMGDHHEKLFKYLQGKSTFDFLDPVNGMDLVLTYEKYSEAQTKQFFGAKFGFKAIDLNSDRERTPISDDPEKTWAEIEKTMKNVDTDIPKYEIKTSEDTLEVVKNWAKEQEKQDKYNQRYKPVDEAKDNDGEVVASAKATVKSEVVKEEDMPAEKVVTEQVEEVKSPDASARKARALAMLNRAKG